MTLLWSLFKGSALGLVLGAVAIVVLSLAMPLPVGNTPPKAPLTESPVVAQSDETSPEEVAIASLDVAPETVETPTAPEPSSSETTTVNETDPAALPTVSMQAPLPDAPVETAGLQTLTDPDSPVFPNPQSLAPQTPIRENDIVVSTEPAQPPAPVVIDDEPMEEEVQEVVIVETIEEDAQPNGPEVSDQEPMDTVEVMVAEDPIGTEEASEIAQNDEAHSPGLANTLEAPTTVATINGEDDILNVAVAPIKDVAELAESEVIAPAAQVLELGLSDETMLAPEPPIASDATAEIAAPGQSVAPVVPETDTAANVAPIPGDISEPEDIVIAALPADRDVTTPPVPTPVETIEVAVVQPPTTPTVRSLIDRNGPAAAMPQGASGVRINRILTSVEPVETPEEETTEAPETGKGALSAFSEPIENDGTRPLMSVALFDDGSFAEGVKTLSDSGLTVTVVLDAAKADAAERMAQYRAANIEVAMTVALPDGATASDAAIALEAAGSDVSEAVAYVDVNGVITGRDIAAQISLAIAEDGLGLVLPSAGLNSGLQEAAAVDVPAVLINRDISAVKQDTRTLVRFLGQAAFQSRQSDAIVILGRLNAETLSALQAFQETQRGKSVSLAPISAALLAN